MGYLPLARKYRPQNFANLIGQPHVTETLTRAIEAKRLGQAYLFTGQRGVGKTSAARILAKCLNCSKGPSAKPCQKCTSCVSITQGNSLDVIEIDGASNRGIDEVRSLRETVKFSPAQGAFRVYIIDEVHMLTGEAFNALLKTLEEPPEHVKFIFATTSPQKIPPTILSRCQRFDFRRLDSKTIVKALSGIADLEKIAADESALYQIAHVSEGSLRDAEVILEQLVSFCEKDIKEDDVARLLGSLQKDSLIALTEAIALKNAKEALLIAHEQINQGKEVLQVLAGLLNHLRDLLIIRTTQNTASKKQSSIEALIDASPEQLEAISGQAKKFGADELLVMLQLLSGAHELAKRSSFAKTILELSLIRLSTRESWESLGQILNRLDELSKQPNFGPGSAKEDSARNDKPGSLNTISPVPIKLAQVDLPKMPQPINNQPNIEEKASFKQEAAVSVIAEPSFIAELMSAWPKVLEYVASKKMMVAACLTYAKPISIKDGIIQIGLPSFNLHQEVLSDPVYLRIVEEAFEAVLNAHFSVQYTTLPDAQDAQPSYLDLSLPKSFAKEDAPEEPMPPIVSDIVSLFDAKIIPSSGKS